MTFSWKSYGAADEVTGSCHLIDCGGRRVLIDCGVFQGPRSRTRNEPPFPFDPSSIDALVVTHAHLDHIGRIPLLVKEGFSGPIFSTRATFELARLSLADSVNIMAQDAGRENRRRKKRGNPERVEPLYDEDDLFQATERWNGQLEYGRTAEVVRGISVTPQDAGHILGSCSFLIELAGEGDGLRIAVSGDLGDDGRELSCNASPGPPADLAVVESTYGDRDHRSVKETRAEFEEVIAATFERGGNVVIPTFALERAQELLVVLHDLWSRQRLPKETKIYLDSPMATNATGIYRRHLGLLNQKARAKFGDKDDPFSFPALRYTRSVQESMQINKMKSGAVILAGSGMVTGGRVLDHLRHNLERPESSVVFVGYQAAGTKGRLIVDGVQDIRIHGQTLTPQAAIHTIGGFSAHAGQSRLIRWVEETGAKEVIIVHGEERAMGPLADRLSEQGVRRLTGSEIPLGAAESEA